LVIPRDTTVLIIGETGTGKELMARAIHDLSPRARQPFVIVNCAAIPETLLESELFGYSRGAFTGAFQSRLGRIHAAHGGTLFLDEVGGLPLGMQGKLLRFLQEGEVQRLGSADVFRVDVRVIAATNVDLARATAEGRFNNALYYRLCVFPIQLPPLRQRREDILPLATHFLESLCRKAAVPRKSIPSEVAGALEAHSWPGNVRELKHTIERAFILSENMSALCSEHIHLSI
jgi:transcriptional regulator with GAF, ATPase, and Fis domain